MAVSAMDSATAVVLPHVLSPSKKSCHHSHHEKDSHLLILEEGKFTYVSVPPLPFPETEETKLCFSDHSSGKWDPRTEQCCLREGGHVHAHVHRGEITEDVLLEQCMEEAGCALPMPWELPGLCLNDLPDERDHVHMEGCGHDQIAHGDHFDWLVPMNDGSFMLSHALQSDDGASQFIRHGRLVKIGESQGRLRQHRRQLFDLFGYEGPQTEGGHEDWKPAWRLSKDRFPTNTSKPLMHQLSEAEKPLLEEGTIKVQIDREGPYELQKTTLDVLGICCPAEIPLVKKILEPLPGVQDVLVNVTAKTVTVFHDPELTSAARLVKLLNDARLEASIHRRGEFKAVHKWPSPYTVASGLLVVVTFFHYIYGPLRWVGLGAVAVGVAPIILRSLISLRRWILDINVLMLIAVAGAVGLGDYLEAGSIVFLFTLADWLESRSSDKARLAISSLASLAPQNAVLANSGLKVPVTEVTVGTKLAVKAGELIPIDGIVLSGKSAVDESSLTGESFPAEKEVGGSVWAGTMNMTGYICVETTALAENSAVSRMARLVEEAQNQRSRIDQLVEKFAKFYTPAVVVAAVAIVFIPLALHTHHIRHWLYLALVLLVVACPCALVISTPVATTCAIARAAQIGLIVRGGSYLEALGKLKVVAMDKTGTLTEGQFQVIELYPLNDKTDVQQLLYWVSCIESKSSHPMAAALIAYANLHGIDPSGDVEDFTIFAGEGVSGVVGGHRIVIGNDRLAERLHWTEADMVESRMLETWNNQGWTVCWVGVDGRVVALLCAGDKVRSEAHQAVLEMRSLGLRIVMLTGDSLAAAIAVQRKLGDVEIHARLLPEDKVEVLTDLKKSGLTGMVGDGINDAPALATADVGIAMGVAGSAIAMETADIALMTNDLRKLAAAIKLGRKARRKIHQNIFLSFVVKLLVIGLALAGYASLWGAVLADVGTCLVVIFNSMLLLGRFLYSSKPKCCQSLQSCKSRGEALLKSDDSSCCNNRLNQEGYLGNCSVAKSCCELNSKNLNSGMRRRLCQKDTCSKDCQGVECSSTLLTISEGLGSGRNGADLGDACLGSAGHLCTPDLPEQSGGKENQSRSHQEASLCTSYCCSENRSHGRSDDSMCATYCGSEIQTHLRHDTSSHISCCKVDCKNDGNASSGGAHISCCKVDCKNDGNASSSGAPKQRGFNNNVAKNNGSKGACVDDCRAMECCATERAECCSSIVIGGSSKDEGQCCGQGMCCDKKVDSQPEKCSAMSFVKNNGCKVEGSCVQGTCCEKKPSTGPEKCSVPAFAMYDGHTFEGPFHDQGTCCEKKCSNQSEKCCLPSFPVDFSAKEEGSCHGRRTCSEKTCCEKKPSIQAGKASASGFVLDSSPKAEGQCQSACCKK